MRLQSLGRRSERGAALVEFAVVMPLLILLLFGIMEAGWFFAQQVEVNNAAREGGRLAVVDYPGPDFGDSIVIRDQVCSRAALSADRAAISITFDAVADTATVTVTQTYESLTGFIPEFDGAVISSTVVMRNERDTLTWTDLLNSNCP
jgi:hypothetical protein